MEVIVAGAGPAGLMAAIHAARGGARVTVIERKDKPLKKLYATGNGRCNFSNLNMDGDVYRGNDPGYARLVTDCYDRNSLLLFFHNLGMMTKHIGDYIYPYNEQARTVADVLLLECRRLSVRIKCNEQVVDIIRKSGRSENDGGFEIITITGRYNCDKVIVATGGKASPVHGSDGNLNGVLISLGHTMITQRPALVPLKFSDKRLAKLVGVRVKCAVSLTADDEVVSEERGEIILNKDNISGIPVMQMSRYATEALAHGKAAEVHIDLFPDETLPELKVLLNNTFHPEYAVFDSVEQGNRVMRSDIRRDRSALEALSLCLNEKLADYCLSLARIVPGSLSGNVSDGTLNRLAGILKDIRVTVTGDAGYERAQVTSGGISTDELTADLGSRLIPGLYIVGELCDVDGTCGGYNLQWAFSSGALAGTDAAGGIK